MKRKVTRPPRWGAVVNLPCRYLLAFILFSLIHLVPAIADTEVDYWAPWVTKTTTCSATINWRGESDGLGLIDFATARYYSKHQSFSETIASMAMGSYQHVQLTCLEPNTLYIYRVRPSGNAEAFGNRTFRTMPVSGPFTFVVVSDSQEGHHYTEEKRFKYVAEAIAKEPDVLFILHGGDNAGFDDGSLWSTYFQCADPMLATAAIFPVIGNHEYHNPAGETNPPTAADQYHWAYDMPLNYSFDCARVRFVILNSPDPLAANEDDPQTSLALAQSQVPWLRKQLNRNMAGIFTIHHHPIWDYGRATVNPDLQPWETLYHSYKISANFAGHTHNYQRFSVQGIPYFIAGFGGGRCAELAGPEPIWYDFGETRKLGYMKVFVDPTHNTATAQEVIVGYVDEDDSDETPYVYDPPVIGDTVTFRLRR